MRHQTVSHHAAAWHVSTPSLTAGEFLARLEDRGWTAEDAFIAYTEWREVGAPLLERDKEGSSNAREHALIRTRLATALESLERPEDLTLYRRHLAAVAGGWRPLWGTDDAPPEDFGADLRTGRVWYLLNHYHLWDDQATTRRTLLPTVEPEEWRSVREVGMDWEDVRESVERDVLRRQQTLEHPPQGVASKRAAIATLVEALEETGVPYFSWSAATGANPETLTLLAAELRHANHELEDTTGWQGPLLGLGGKVGVSLGTIRGSSGLCSAFGQHLLQSSPTTVWTPMAHEWLHALDSAMSSYADRGSWPQGTPGGWHASETAQASHDGLVPQAWFGLLKDLRDPQLAEHEQHAMAQSLVDGFEARWKPRKGLSDTLQKAVMAELKASADSHWVEAEAFQRLMPVFAEHLKERTAVEKVQPADPTTIQFHTSYAMADIAVMREGVSKTHRSRSVWIQYRERLDAHAELYPDLARWKNYFQEPAEQVAFSFEALIAPKPERIISNIGQRGSENLSYPLAEESIHQRIAWRRFFETAQDWWGQRRAAWEPVKPVEVDSLQAMAARLQARRARLTDADGALSPSRPRLG